jgi:NhaA family Na+:H+ antiporter
VDLPANATWLQLYGISLLYGIGFTMSLFIGLLASPTSPELQDATKIGVLSGSLLSGAAGALLLRLSRPEPVGIYSLRSPCGKLT